jgi:putative heme-binding domain-containing protein
LGHAVRWHEIEPYGSSFKSHNGGELLLANDTWFAPSDVCLGPDGCVYVADWFDARTAHPDPDAEWDRTNGRIYRIAFGDPPPARGLDLTKKSSAELVEMLSHPNDWYARMARHVLADRRDPEVILPLRTLIREAPTEELALQALWALYVTGGFTEGFGRELLADRREHIRSWAVRLLGDEDRIMPATLSRLADLARTDPGIFVRSQLAATARRLPAADAASIAWAIAARDLDTADPHVPLLLWWALEHHVMPARRTMTATFARPEAWSATLTRTVLLPRLMRRYAAAGSPDADQTCVDLPRAAPDGASRTAMWAALEEGLRERPGSSAPTAVFVRALRQATGGRTDGPVPVRVLARLGDHDARTRLVETLRDHDQSEPVRLAALTALADMADTAAGRIFLDLARADGPPALRTAPLDGWAHVGTDAEAAALLGTYSQLPPQVRTRARSVLVTRRSWAALLMKAIDEGRVAAADITSDELFAVAGHRDPALKALVRKHWGAVRGRTPEEKLAEVRRFNNDLRAGVGNAKLGRDLFVKHCATCHRLHREGGAVGPDLTHANRADRDFLLVSLVDPSAVIRKEFVSYSAETHDGRVITGVMTAQTAATVMLTNAKAEATTLKRTDIASLRESPASLMPEGLLTPLKPEELRDLFAYFQAPARR